jgi:hypothetical protein
MWMYLPTQWISLRQNFPDLVHQRLGPLDGSVAASWAISLLLFALASVMCIRASRSILAGGIEGQNEQHYGYRNTRLTRSSGSTNAGRGLNLQVSAGSNHGFLGAKRSWQWICISQWLRD